MGSLLVSCLGLVLCLALVCRAVQQGWWRVYPVVFGYCMVMAAHFCGAWWVSRFRPDLYAVYYWLMEGVLVVFGFGLIWQVYAAIPRQYPGVGRVIKQMAQHIAAAGPFFLVVAVLFARRGTLTLDVVERNFRAMQAILICIVFGLAMYFDIPLSRNLRALVQGYGLYIFVFIVRYTLWPMQYTGFWPYVMPAAYTAAQLIWLTGLWEYENPADDLPVAGPESEDQTHSLMIRLRKQLGRPFIHE